MFVRELTLSVVLSRPGTEVLAVQILRFADDGLWGRLSALGIIMIVISTALVVLATLIGAKLRARGGRRIDLVSLTVMQDRPRGLASRFVRGLRGHGDSAATRERAGRGSERELDAP